MTTQAAGVRDRRRLPRPGRAGDPGRDSPVGPARRAAPTPPCLPRRRREHAASSAGRPDRRNAAGALRLAGTASGAHRHPRRTCSSQDTWCSIRSQTTRAVHTGAPSAPPGDLRAPLPPAGHRGHHRGNPPGKEQFNSRGFIFSDDRRRRRPAMGDGVFGALRPLQVRWASQCDILIAREREAAAGHEASGCLGLILGLESPRGLDLREARQTVRPTGEYLARLARIRCTASASGQFYPGFDGDDWRDCMNAAGSPRAPG